MTATVTVGEGTAYVFVAVDHFADRCVDRKRGTRFDRSVNASDAARAASSARRVKAKLDTRAYPNGRTCVQAPVTTAQMDTSRSSGWTA